MPSPETTSHQQHTAFFIASRLFDHALRAAAAIQTGERVGGQREALTAIVFAAVSLEAFINECADMARDLNTMKESRTLSAFFTLMDELEESRTSIDTKFRLARLAVSGVPFETGVQPFQDFKLLIALRNALVHLKGLEKHELNRESNLYVPSKVPNIVERLESKNILADATSDNQPVSWIDRVTTRAAADWACIAASRIVNALLDAITEGGVGPGGIISLYRNQFPRL